MTIVLFFDLCYNSICMNTQANICICYCYIIVVTLLQYNAMQLIILHHEMLEMIPCNYFIQHQARNNTHTHARTHARTHANKK